MEDFKSKLFIGDPVFVKLQNQQIDGWIRTVLFTNGKVRYSVRCPINDGMLNEDDFTTLHNLDSILVEFNESGERLVTEFDNYS